MGKFEHKKKITMMVSDHKNLNKQTKIHQSTEISQKRKERERLINYRKKDTFKKITVAASMLYLIQAGMSMEAKIFD